MLRAEQRLRSGSCVKGAEDARKAHARLTAHATTNAPATIYSCEWLPYIPDRLQTLGARQELRQGLLACCNVGESFGGAGEGKHMRESGEIESSPEILSEVDNGESKPVAAEMRPPRECCDLSMAQEHVGLAYVAAATQQARKARRQIEQRQRSDIQVA